MDTQHPENDAQLVEGQPDKDRMSDRNESATPPYDIRRSILGAERDINWALNVKASQLKDNPKLLAFVQKIQALLHPHAQPEADFVADLLEEPKEPTTSHAHEKAS